MYAVPSVVGALYMASLVPSGVRVCRPECRRGFIYGVPSAVEGLYMDVKSVFHIWFVINCTHRLALMTSYMWSIFGNFDSLA
jgi:hypothetical protein